MEPAVSIIVAAYNTEEYIAHCLTSIINQTYNNIEIIVIDDGSTDETGEIIDKALSGDKRAWIIHQDNQGVSRARNKGIESASGEYLFFCDADDWLEADAIGSLYSVAKEQDLDIIYFDHFRDSGPNSREIKLFPEPFVSTKDTAVNDALRAAALYVPSANFKTKCFNKILYGGGSAWKYMLRRQVVLANKVCFDSRLDGMMEDAIFSFDVIKHCINIGYISKPMYHYLVHDNSTIHRYVPDCSLKFDRVIESVERRLKAQPSSALIQKALNMRITAFIDKMCEMNLCNADNPSPDSTRYYAFLQYIKSDKVYKAIQEADLCLYGNNRVRLQVLLLKLHLYRIYWMIKMRKK